MTIPNPQTSAFWHQAAAWASADAVFNDVAGHLRNIVVQVGVGAESWQFRIDRGRIALTDRTASPAFAIAGPAEEWDRLVRGEIPYGQAINVTLGQLRVSGDALAATWCVRPLWQLWRLTARQAAGGNEHA